VPQSTLARLAPLTGIVFVALVVLSFIISGESPSADDSTQEVIEYWTDNDSENQWAAALISLGAAFLVWFGGTLRAALRRAEGEPGRVAATAFGGFITMAVGITAFAGFAFAAADTVGDVPPEVTQTLSVLNSDFFFMVAMGNLVAFTATAVAILRHGAMPRWLGYLAALIAVVSVTPAGFFAFLAGGIWILIASVVLYQGQGQPPAPAPATAPPPR
jgi:hypothetical protein